jgi:hypothetical protein
MILYMNEVSARNVMEVLNEHGNPYCAEVARAIHKALPARMERITCYGGPHDGATIVVTRATDRYDFPVLEDVAVIAEPGTRDLMYDLRIDRYIRKTVGETTRAFVYHGRRNK